MLNRTFVSRQARARSAPLDDRRTLTNLDRNLGGSFEATLWPVFRSLGRGRSRPSAGRLVPQTLVLGAGIAGVDQLMRGLPAVTMSARRQAPPYETRTAAGRHGHPGRRILAGSGCR